MPTLQRTLLHPLWAACLVLFLLPGCGTNGSDGPGASDGTSAQASSEQTPPADTPGGEEETQVVNLADLGFNEGVEAENQVYVVEFSDFGCIHCARFHLESWEPLRDEFVDGGDVVWKYIPITIGGFPNGGDAAIAGTCAGYQDRFAPMRSILYERQRQWSQRDQDPAIFREFAVEIGLDMDAFDACRAGTDVREEILLNDRVALQIGVNATPTFLVQGQSVQGAPPLDAFQEALRQLLAQVRTP